MKKEYIALYSDSKPYLGQLGSYDMHRKKWISNPYRLTMDEDLGLDLEASNFGNCYFLQSVHRDLAIANFSRNRNGEISIADRVFRLSITEGIILATKVYRSSEAQLANLNPEALTPANRYVKRVTIFTDSLLEQVTAYQAVGMTLRNVAKKLNVNYESLRRTMRSRPS